MKNLWAIIAMMFVFAFTATEAQAKKFGGGKSFGRSYQTAPAPAAKPDAPSQTAAPAAGAAAGKKGMLGGLMGGLLAGGLIAALLGGAFEGIQFMDILILGLLAFVIFKLLRGRRPAQAHTPAYAGGQGGQHSERRAFDFDPKSSPVMSPASGGVTASGFSVSQVPFNLPKGFDMTSFLAGARDHYRTLQDAWNKNDLVKIQEYVSPELYNELRAERSSLSGEQHTEVLFVDAELVRADQIGSRAEVSVKFTGRYRDTVENVEEPITDIWHLERDTAQPGSPWYIVGIEA